MSEDWLWDGSGEPDAPTAGLIEALAPLRYRGPPPVFRKRARRLAPVGLLAALVLLAFGVSVWRSREVPSWACGEGCELRAGEWLVPSQAVRLTVADIGTMLVSPGARLRLLSTSSELHRLELQRGSVHARVLAPPRLLVVDTPSATAVDLGCEYDLTVLEDGSSLLIVYTGEVSLEGKAVSYVPAGAAALGWPGHGPGIPWFADAPVRYAEALVAWEREGQDERLPEILAASRAEDTLSLWHLLQRVEVGRRGEVLDRIVQLVPEAQGIEREGVLALDPGAVLELKAVLSDYW